jgi:hypothetical protein
MSFFGGNFFGGSFFGGAISQGIQLAGGLLKKAFRTGTADVKLSGIYSRTETGLLSAIAKIRPAVNVTLSSIYTASGIGIIIASGKVSIQAVAQLSGLNTLLSYTGTITAGVQKNARLKSIMSRTQLYYLRADGEISKPDDSDMIMLLMAQ